MNLIIKKRYYHLKKALTYFWLPIIAILAGSVFPPLAIIGMVFVAYGFFRYIAYALSPCPKCGGHFFGFPSIISGSCYSMINDSWKCNCCGEKTNQ